MTIKCYDDSGCSKVPEPDSAIFITNGEKIFVRLALRYDCDLGTVVAVRPSCDKVALFDIPDEDVFVGADNGIASGDTSC